MHLLKISLDTYLVILFDFPSDILHDAFSDFIYMYFIVKYLFLNSIYLLTCSSDPKNSWFPIGREWSY